MIWKPFDAFFKDLIDRMHKHDQFLKDELQFILSDVALDAVAFQKTQTAILEGLQIQFGRLHTSIIRDSDRATVQHLVDWLAAPPFAQSLEDSHVMEQA